MAGVARSDSFFVALMAWVFVLLLLGVNWVDASFLDDRTPLWLALGGTAVVAAIGTWLLIHKTSVFRRMSNRMSQWGLGVAQLTLIAYVCVMPVYLVICLFDRGGDEYY